MGEHAIRAAADEVEERAFTQAVLRDIEALEALVARGGIETGITRMGAEQELYLIGPDRRPAPRAQALLERLNDPMFTTELARFNLEANFAPQRLGGDFLGQLHRALAAAMATVSHEAGALDLDVLLTGILPTLRLEDLGADNLSPDLRYQCLDAGVFRGRDAISVAIDGIERFEGAWSSVVLEGANTSLQLHLQVAPDTAADRYNLMQLITAPLLAVAANSPVLLGKRLWHETRIAVFERALDGRSVAQMNRGSPTRVSFGHGWVEGSLLDLYRDNIARFPVILVRDLEEDSRAVVEAGGVPKLAALALHNGTVWRWNRPCYGAVDGVAHLRIENRVLPAGPTLIDEVANAALFYGLMAGLPAHYGDVRRALPFEDVERNFLAAAREGLEARFTWLNDRRVDASRLILDELLPVAREGLAAIDVPMAHIERYLGVIQARTESGRTGARWLLNSLQAQRDRDRSAVLGDAVAAMLEGQRQDRPVHEWPLAAPAAGGAPAVLTVAAFMTTDLFTVAPDDVVDLATSVMDWKHVRHVPVETRDGDLVGVLTARDLLALRHREAQGDDATAVRDLMRADLVRIAPEAGLAEALDAMLDNDAGCLMVVRADRLIGLVTERDLLRGLRQELGQRRRRPGDGN